MTSGGMYMGTPCAYRCRDKGVSVSARFRKEIKLTQQHKVYAI